GKSLDRLMGRTVLTKTNGVVGGNPNDLVVREGRETDGTGGVGDEVQESTTIGNSGTVDGQTVHDGTHTVLTDTVADIATSPVTETSRRGLEVGGALPPGQVG